MDKDYIQEPELLSQDELMKANEAATVSFGHSLRGYNPDEVDDFLDAVAESLHRYAEIVGEKDRQIQALGEQLRDYDHMRDSLEEALRVTQEEAQAKLDQVQAAYDEVIGQAKLEAEKILQEARERREGTLMAAQENALKLMKQTEGLRARRDEFLQEAKLLAANFNAAIALLAKSDDGE